jgi:hypothetical protein
MAGLVAFRENSAMPAEVVREEVKTPDLDSLSAYLMQAWEAARDFKRPIELKMLAMVRQSDNQYDPAKLAEIKSLGMSEVFLPVTQRKCRDAKAWIMDIVKVTGADKSWACDPTPIPDLDPALVAEIDAEVMGRVEGILQQELAVYGQFSPETVTMVAKLREEAQEKKEQEAREEAKERAEQMTTLIEDKLAEGGFPAEFLEFLEDLVNLKAGILKGPVYRNRLTQQGWVQDAEGGWTPNYVEATTMDVDRVDPFRFFPGPHARRIQDTYTVEWHELTAKQLQELKGVAGYSDTAIDAVLEGFGGGSGRWIDAQVLQTYREARMGMQNRTSPSTWDDRFDALEFWIPIMGKLLSEWEIPDLEDDRVYDVNCWLVQNQVIKCVINPDKLGRNPYCMTSFIKRNGTVWGCGLPETIEDDQAAINMLARATCNNAAFASMPQISVNALRLAAQESAKLHPGKVWRHDGGSITGDEPIKFFQPPVVVAALIGALHEFLAQADADSGVPAYAHGDARVGGAGSTSSGLSMLISMASRGIYSVVSNICNDAISPLITRFYDALMLHHPDNSVKGDAKVVAAGVAALMQREQAAVRLNEFAAQTNNPTDMQIITLKGRAELLRALASRLDLPVDKIIPGNDELAQIEALLQQKLAAGAGQPGGVDPGVQQGMSGSMMTDAAGAPVSGQDHGLFQQSPIGV